MPIVVTLVLIALLGALLWFLAVNVLNNDDQQTGVLVTVPDVVGDKRAQAISELEDAGLEVGTITPVPAADDTQEPGTVLEQDPPAGDEVDRGTNVDLTIVAAPDQVAIPDLEGSSVEEAQAALIELGLEPAGPVEEPSDTVDEGSVTRTDPASGRGGRAGIDGDDLRLDRAEQVAVPEVTVPELRLGPERALSGGPELGHLERHRGAEPPCARSATRSPRRIPPRDPGRPRDDRDPVPGRGSRSDRPDRPHGGVTGE